MTSEQQAIHNAICTMAIEGFAVTQEEVEAARQKRKQSQLDQAFAKEAEKAAAAAYPKNQKQQVLKNVPGFLTEEELHLYERKVAFAALYEMELMPIAGKLDLPHLLKIHKTIFVHIYPFAGAFRDVNIAKGDFMFANARFLQESCRGVFEQLGNENFQGLPLLEMAEKMAYYHTELMVNHPFREGNGRAIREFIRVLALRNGYRIHWGKTTKERYMPAAIQSVYDHTALTDLFSDIMEAASA